MPISPRPSRNTTGERIATLNCAFASGRDVADGAAVDAARLGLQLGDQLHGADLRRADDRARREDARISSLKPDALLQRGAHAGRHLVQRPEGLDREQVRHARRCRSRRCARGRCASGRRSSGSRRAASRRSTACGAPPHRPRACRRATPFPSSAASTTCGRPARRTARATPTARSPRRYRRCRRRPRAGAGACRDRMSAASPTG